MLGEVMGTYQSHGKLEYVTSLIIAETEQLGANVQDSRETTQTAH